MKTKNDIFQSFTSKKAEFAQIGEVSNHEFAIGKIMQTGSFHKLDGTLKDPLPAWSDECPQYAMTFFSTTEKDKDGNRLGITRRFNGLGYVKYEELTREQQESGKFSDEKGYACEIAKDEKKYRLVSPERTGACRNILNQLFVAIGMKEGSTLNDLEDRAIADQYPVKATVTRDSYTDEETGETSDQFNIGKFRRPDIKAEEVTEATQDWSEEGDMDAK